jgi:lipopolysaccharide transport system permease protein
MDLAAFEVLRDLGRHQQLLLTTTRVEMVKRYAGSVLGVVWIVLNPLLFLGVYLFLYMVIFRTRFPGTNELGYSLYIFAGLVPYMAFMDVASTSTQIIRGNIGFVKNLIFPIALVPMRVVLIGMLTQFVGLAMVIVLALLNGDFAWHLLPLLAGVLVIEFLFLLGVAFFISAFGVMLQDFSYFLSTLLLFILFISPIGFRPDMVPRRLGPMVTFNPFYYMIDAFRSALVTSHGIHWFNIAVFGVIACVTFALGAAFFRRFRLHLVDYE